MLIGSNLTEQCQNSKIILWGSTEIYFKYVCCETSKGPQLVNVKDAPGTKCWIWKHPSESYMNLCTQAPGHCFSAIYNLGMPTPWLQRAALASTAPEGHSGVREGQLKLAKGGSSWHRWRHQKGCKLSVWSLWGRLRPPGYDQGYSLPSWFYKRNAAVCQIAEY